jgi:hypothetical protein
VLCAYLRTPYTPPPTVDPNTETSTAATTEPDPGQRHRPQQELQVRKSPQRLLAVHVQRPLNSQPENAAQMHSSRQLTFWPGINLDLTGATLVDFEVHDAVVNADFHGANFIGDASLHGATFTGDALFGSATFTRTAWFHLAAFTDAAEFDGALVRNLDIAHERLWPAGWIVRVNPDDSTSGRLVRSGPTPPGAPHTPGCRTPTKSQWRRS